jgi:hypothetical protein
MYAIYGIFCRRLDAQCRFVSIVSYGVSMLLLARFGIEVSVATVGVVTLSACSIMCRRASRGSSTIHIWNVLSASVFSVVSCGSTRLICAKDGILCRRRKAYRPSSRLGFVCAIVVYHPEGHISFNFIEKIIPKPKIFTDTRT